MQSYYHDQIQASARRDTLLAEARREQMAAAELRPAWLTDYLMASLGDLMVTAGKRLQRARVRRLRPLPVYPEFVRD